MGITERKEREKEERRKLILDYTKQLIIENGVEAVSMQDIAKKAELSKATLYLYFESKEAILEHIFNEAGSYFVDYVGERLSKNMTGLEAIRLLWMSYIEIFGESSDIFVMFGIKNFIAPGFPFIIGESDRARSMPPFRLYRQLVEVLSRGVADGTLDPAIESERVARTVILITGGIIDNVARLPSHLRDSKLILSEMKSTFEIVLRGLASNGCDRSLLVLP